MEDFMKKIGLIISIVCGISSLMAVPKEDQINAVLNHINDVLQRHPGQGDFIVQDDRNGILTLNKIREQVQRGEGAILEYRYLISKIEQRLICRGIRQNLMIPHKNNGNL
jgi:hypothetical protein